MKLNEMVSGNKNKFYKILVKISSGYIDVLLIQIFLIFTLT